MRGCNLICIFFACILSSAVASVDREHVRPAYRNTIPLAQEQQQHGNLKLHEDSTNEDLPYRHEDSTHNNGPDVPNGHEDNNDPYVPNGHEDNNDPSVPNGHKDSNDPYVINGNEDKNDPYVPNGHEDNNDPYVLNAHEDSTHNGNPYVPNADLLRQQISSHFSQSSTEIDMRLIDAPTVQRRSLNVVHHQEIDTALDGLVKISRNVMDTSAANVSDQCQRRWSQFTVDLTRRKPYALKAFDSFGKPGSGMSEGNLNWVGAFDLCREVQWDELPGGEGKAAPPKGKHCMVKLQTGSGITFLQMGFCFPDTCSSAEASEIASHIFSNLNVEVTCFENEEIGAASIIWFSWTSLALLLIVIATIWESVDIIKQQRQQALLTENKQQTDEEKAQTRATEQSTAADTSVIKQYVCAFSALSNGSRLMSTHQGGDKFLASLNGLRVISMWWVVMGHVCLYTLPYIKQTTTTITILKQFSFRTVTQMGYAVDTFFFSSGLLVSYLNLKKLRRGNGRLDWVMFYIHRIWRLTPFYLFCMLFYMGVYKLLLVSPHAERIKHSGVMRDCEGWWWANLVYVNNIVPDGKKMCMGWSWYLANDMQFFIISPIFIYLLYRWRYIGCAVLTTVLAASLSLTGAVAAKNDLSCMLFSNQTLFYTERQNEMVNLLYVRPYYRISPYLVGIAAGYVLYRTRGAIKLPWYVALAGWCICSTLCMLLVFGLQPYYSDFSDPPPGISAWYYSCSRCAWALCMAWIVLACGHGYGGPIDKVLSWKVWTPLYKLNYAAYLLHFYVIFYYYSESKDTVYYSNYTVAQNFFGVMVVVYGFCIATNLVVELPMQLLEKLVFKR